MKGKISAGIFKVMAVVSALAIGGVYVAWRQAEADKANKRERIEQAKAEDKDRLLLSGSKSYTGGTLLKEGDLTDGILPPLEEVEGEESPLLPGSKSISMPLFTKEQLDELDKNWEAGHGKLPAGREEEKSKNQELLPSSKIGILRLPTKEAESPAQKKPGLLPGSKSAAIEIIPEEPEKSK